MKHRKMLIAGIITIATGIVLWLVIGSAIALAGVATRYEGWFPFGHTVTELTPLFWVGYALSLAGLVIFAIGIVLLILAFVLEILDKEKKMEASK
jgi:hypothetical protein